MSVCALQAIALGLAVLVILHRSLHRMPTATASASTLNPAEAQGQSADQKPSADAII